MTAARSAGGQVIGHGGQFALSLIVAWRETDGALSRDAFAQKLAEVAADGGAAAVENAVLGLTALGNMPAELYVDSVGRSMDAVLADAAALEWGLRKPGIARPGPFPGRRSAAAADVTGGNDARGASHRRPRWPVPRPGWPTAPGR